MNRHSIEAVQFCNTQLVQPYQFSGYNVYDMRKLCGDKPLCYDFTDIERYLNSAEVKTKLGVTKSWASCNMKVNAAMQGDWMRAYATTIPPMLQDNIPVLIYAGKLAARSFLLIAIPLTPSAILPLACLCLVNQLRRRPR
jgi:cathepsin A (carboxypeptidase C)